MAYVNFLSANGGFKQEKKKTAADSAIHNEFLSINFMVGFNTSATSCLDQKLCAAASLNQVGNIFRTAAIPCLPLNMDFMALHLPLKEKPKMETTLANHKRLNQSKYKPNSLTKCRQVQQLVPSQTHTDTH